MFIPKSYNIMGNNTSPRPLAKNDSPNSNTANKVLFFKLYKLLKAPMLHLQKMVSRHTCL